MFDDSQEKPSLGLDEYALEAPLNCHHCMKEVAVIHVVRLLRTKVNFISTLPRRGYVIVCPACRGILSADLGGMA